MAEIGLISRLPLCEQAPNGHSGLIPAWLVACVKLVSNLEKVMILDNLDVCKPLILLALQKNIKIISPQILTVAIGFVLCYQMSQSLIFKDSTALMFLSGSVLIYRFMWKWCKIWCSTPLYINKAAYG